MRLLRNKTENREAMAIFHLSVKAISRSAGRSATAAAAYRAGCEIVDERTGEVHDYRRKHGVESADLVLPDGAPEWASNRAQLWNAAERAEKRKDACVAREFEVALPAELTPAERRQLALEFAKELANREGCAVDVAIHAPHREGDQRNHHAHMLRTTRKVEIDGLGAKLDTEQAGRKRKDDLGQARERWAELTNAALARAGHQARIDHRTLEQQGIEREPTRHLGPAAIGFERRTGQTSDKRRHQEERQAREVEERLIRAKEAGELERQSRQLESSVLDLSGDLKAAKAERDRQPTQEVRQAVAAGVADFRAQYQQYKQIEAAKLQAREAVERQKLEQAYQRKQAEQAAEVKRLAEIERQQQAQFKAKQSRGIDHSR